MTEFTFFNYKGSIDYMRKYRCMVKYLFEKYAYYVYDMFDDGCPAWKRFIEPEFIEHILFMWVLDEYDEKQMYWTEKLLGEKCLILVLVIFGLSIDYLRILFNDALH